jgi:hypothetical protein
VFGRLDEAEGGEQMMVDIRRLLHSRHSSVVVVINVWRFGGGFVGFVIVVFVVLITSVVITNLMNGIQNFILAATEVLGEWK